MPSPIVSFAFILATLYGAAVHLIFGGNGRRLAAFLLASWVGFGVGQLAGVVLGIDLFNIGVLRVVPATLGAFIALAVAFLMTSQRARKRSTR